MLLSLKSSLDKVAQAFPQAFADKDIDQIINFFAEDAIAMYPGWSLPVTGKDANREAWVNYYAKNKTHPISTDSVVVAASNDLGHSFGRWATAETDELGAAAGRYTAIWQRKNQQWQIVVLSAHVHEDIAPFSF
jgi:ketosteroid isomerase-like protein